MRDIIQKVKIIISVTYLIRERFLKLYKLFDNLYFGKYIGSKFI
jgi:hypothetical protein